MSLFKNSWMIIIIVIPFPWTEVIGSFHGVVPGIRKKQISPGGWRALGQTTRPLWRPPFIGASNSGPEVAERQRRKQTSRIKIDGHNARLKRFVLIINTFRRQAAGTSALRLTPSRGPPSFEPAILWAALFLLHGNSDRDASSTVNCELPR